MAHDKHPAGSTVGRPDTEAARAEGHGAGTEHAHPSYGTYFKVAVFLTVITIVEVWVYYIPPFVASPWFVPSLLIMSAVKFATVVMFYMHLKYDHKIFRALFVGPFIIAAVTLIALLFLFGQVALRFGAVS